MAIEGNRAPVQHAVSHSGAVVRFVDLQSKLLALYDVRATSRFVELRNPRMRVHVLEAGVGEPVVLIHGGDGEGVNWSATMGPLQQSARLFAIDRPGFGLSDGFDYRHVNLREHAGEFVVSLLDALGLGSATLVGSSMGGFFATVATLDHPERVRRLVLVGFAVGTTHSMPVGLRIICGVPGLARRFMKARPTMEAQRAQYRNMFHVKPDSIPPLYFELRIAGIQLPSEQGTWATLLPRVAGLRGTRRAVYLGDELSRIEAPCLMIMGEHDMVSADVGRAVVARIRGGQFEYLPGVGHFPYLEAPQETARLISGFLRRTRSADPPDRPDNGTVGDEMPGCATT
jgi:4,5:9,10-diseco-3-hydroxy-5,9,17-trioxoandrosta-1(10),2-diene-4-oate hydrolase